MKDTLENKRKFFGLYWGQEVMYDPFTPFPEKIQKVRIDSKFIFDLHLNLKSVQSLTDQDASILAEKYDIYIGNDPLDQFKTLKEFKESITSENSYPVGFFDFLRSKGYALSWMGLSVEDQIKYGWVKLIN